MLKIQKLLQRSPISQYLSELSLMDSFTQAIQFGQRCILAVRIIAIKLATCWFALIALTGLFFEEKTWKEASEHF